MRTYWAVTETETGRLFMPKGLAAIFKDEPTLRNMQRVLDGHSPIEVAVVPAAALKRLVEACQEAVDTYTYQSDNAGEVFAGPNVVREIRDALSEWKGGAE